MSTPKGKTKKRGANIQVYTKKEIKKWRAFCP